ncbi:polyprotein [Plakobranchus ocellatus]|uniref:Polyprotein n=1 Tax=Plakobranchus ocellatus TaxID=259542 RepID=A0AAV4AUA2_9GAST|nr:polyprotein [Plakobranchus ocellatus]
MRNLFSLLCLTALVVIAVHSEDDDAAVVERGLARKRMLDPTSKPFGKKGGPKKAKKGGKKDSKKALKKARKSQNSTFADDQKTYSDPTREIPLEETTGLVWPAAPGIKFDSKPPSLQEVIAVVSKARAKSAPGPNGVPYLKRCPNVLKKLHKILRSAWKYIKISKEWMTADRVYIPKRARFERNKPVSPNITAQCRG